MLFAAPAAAADVDAAFVFDYAAAFHAAMLFRFAAFTPLTLRSIIIFAFFAIFRALSRFRCCHADAIFRCLPRQMPCAC